MISVDRELCRNGYELIRRHSLSWYPRSQWQIIGPDTDLGNWALLDSLQGRNVFFASLQWSDLYKNLPLGHDCYIVVVESNEVSWIDQQSKRVDSPIFVIGALDDYGYFDNNSKVFHLPSTTWHCWFHKCVDVFGPPPSNKSKHKKISALTNRVGLNKLLGFMSIMENFDESDRTVSLNTVVDAKLLDHWCGISRPEIRDKVNRFVDAWQDQQIRIDDFFSQHNQDIYTQNPMNDAYTDCVFNVSNETVSLSHVANGSREYVLPGPFLTEKTFKPLYMGTGLISNGPFDTYNSLRRLGFNFDYVGLDLSYDDITANFDRLCGMMSVIQHISQLDLDELQEITAISRAHNQEHCLSADFRSRCDKINQDAVQSLHRMMHW